MTDYDASQLAVELSKSRLPSGRLVAGIAIPQKTTKELSTEIKERGCDYLVKVWHHESADTWLHSPAGPPGLMAIPSQMPELPLPRPIHDRDTIDFELRKAGSAYVIAKGVAPVPRTYRGEDHPSSTPYPFLGEQIVAHLTPPR
jgi:hypothetical protein